MRKLHDFEEIGLIGYPADGDYLAMVKGDGHLPTLLGGEICRDGPRGPLTAVRAELLPRYYPGASRLVIATIKGNYLIEIRQYGS